MITVIKTSLFESPAKAIVNTVNTVGVMGKGIAKQFKKLYPDMYREYREYCNSGRFKTGMLHIYRTPNKIIINFPTKAHWRGKSRVEFVEQGLKKFVEHYTAIGINSVSFPQLGCGNGELDWEIEVKPLMLEHLSNLSIPVYIHMYRTPKGFIPERIDKEYKKAVLIERERNSADSVWNDLIMLVSGDNGQTKLFGSPLRLTTGNLQFRVDEVQSIKLNDGAETIYNFDKETFEDLWNLLRLRGVLRANEIPTESHHDLVSSAIMALMVNLEYVKFVEINKADSELVLEEALMYAPLPSSSLPTLDGLEMAK